MVNLRSHVTGNFNGKPVSFYITHSNRSVSDATEAAYRELTGKSLARRRRDWHSFHVKNTPITLTLVHPKHGKETLQINVIGRDAE